MRKETLEKAKQMQEDIRKMSNASSYYKNARWSHWGINDNAGTFHFAFRKNYSVRDADTVTLPRWLNKKLMDVVEQELETLKAELDNLGDDTANFSTGSEANLQITEPTSTNEQPVSKPKQKKSKFIRFMDNVSSWMVYSTLCCGLLWAICSDEKLWQVLGVSLLLGLFLGSINNIERVLRELFEKGGEK